MTTPCCAAHCGAGADSLIAVGDCSAMVGERLPATAQVAGQQGAYVGRLVNRGFRVGEGGTEPPSKPGKGALPDPDLLTGGVHVDDGGAVEPVVPLTEVNIASFFKVGLPAPAARRDAAAPCMAPLPIALCMPQDVAKSFQ